MQQVYLAAYLPEEQTLLGIGGPWTDETSVTLIDRPWRDAAPRTMRRSCNQLRSGIGGCDSAGERFPDRWPAVLVLGPAARRRRRRVAAADGAASTTRCNVGVFLLVAVVGLVLTAQPIGVRLWWLAGLVVLLVLVAVFVADAGRGRAGRRR